jgi:pilus assembly protein CpaB
VLLLALAAAGMLGVFALVANYVSDVDTQVGPKVTVLELTRPAQKNNAITDDMVVDKQIPRRWAPRAALTDRSQLVGVVAGSDLARDSILQEGMLVTPPELHAGEREVAILPPGDNTNRTRPETVFKGDDPTKGQTGEQ